MIHPPLDQLTPGPLVCPPENFNGDGYCFKTSSTSLARNSIAPYVIRGIPWYHNPNFNLSLPKRVNSLILDPDLPLYVAPSGYVLDPSDNAFSDIDVQFFQNWANLSRFSLNRRSVDAFVDRNRYVDHLIQEKFDFDPRLTYPKDPSGTDLCPRYFRIVIECRYELYFDSEFFDIISVIAVHHFDERIGELIDHYAITDNQDFFDFITVNTDDSALSIDDREFPNILIYPTGVNPFILSGYDSLGNLKRQVVARGNPDEFFSVESKLPRTEQSTFVASDPEQLALASPYFTTFKAWAPVTHPGRDESFSARGISYNILSSEIIQFVTNRWTKNYSPRWNPFDSIPAFSSGPPLCGDYSSPSCWARHELEMTVPQYDPVITLTNSQTSLDFSLALIPNGKVSIQRLHLFRFCSNEFSFTGQPITPKWNRSMMYNFIDYSNSQEVITLDEIFWESLMVQNDDDLDQSEILVPFIMNNDIMDDFIPVPGNPYVLDLNDVEFSNLRTVYLYNAEENSSTPNWPNQSRYPIPYDPPNIGGSPGGSGNKSGNKGGSFL